MNFSNLGLAKSAGKLISGEDKVIESIKAKKVFLIFLAFDSGKSTTKRILDKASFYKIRVINLYSSEQLSNAIGECNRHVIAITDRGFAKLLEE